MSDDDDDNDNDNEDDDNTKAIMLNYKLSLQRKKNNEEELT